jgi:hypothetical protein
MWRKFTQYTLLLMVAILVTSTVACAGKPESILLWSKTFGNGEDNYGNSVQQTEDKGYVVCGATGSYVTENFNVWLIKTDTDGNKVWDKIFEYGWGNSVQQTKDSGYILCGTAKGTNGASSYDIWLIKTDAEGNKLWDKKLARGWGNSVQQTTDGSYIICGFVGSATNNADVRLIKTDAEGNKLWGKTFGSESNDYGNAFQQTVDGGYIICGMTGSYSNTDVLLIKTDDGGNKLWDKILESKGNAEGNSVHQTRDGGYIICGTITSYGSDGIPKSNVWLIKTDVDGNKLWDKTFGGVLKVASGKSVEQTTDGGYMIFGTTKSYGIPKSNVWLIKTDVDGNELWDKQFGGEWSVESYSVQQTTDDSYIICGDVLSDSAKGSHILLLKLSVRK